MANLQVAGADPAHHAWWRQRSVLQRFVGDLIADELGRLRRNTDLSRPRPWTDDLRIDRDLGADSLELMSLATALAEAIHLHQSGIEDYLLARRSIGEWVDIAQSGLEHFSRELTFRTSGSTGTPKTCIHPLATLLQETGELARLFGGRTRVLSAVPCHHIYGFLTTVLLPQALGLQSEAVVDLRGSSPARLAHCLQPGDLVIGYPEFWQAAARTVPRMPADVTGVTSTAPCADHISEAIERSGIARLLQIYGASETAGIGWRASHREPYRLFSYWSFAAGQAHCLERTLPDGTRSSAACQDVLERQCDRTFLIGARHDAAVQVGGVNVFPAQVADVLRRHPKVSDAAVRLMRPDEGNRLKAYVVAKPEAAGMDTLLAELTEWIEQELPAPARPKAVRFGASLPLSASGKPCDWEIEAGAPANSTFAEITGPVSTAG